IILVHRCHRPRVRGAPQVANREPRLRDARSALTERRSEEQEPYAGFEWATSSVGPKEGDVLCRVQRGQLYSERSQVRHSLPVSARLLHPNRQIWGTSFPETRWARR